MEGVISKHGEMLMLLGHQSSLGLKFLTWKNDLVMPGGLCLDRSWWGDCGPEGSDGRKSSQY